MNMIHSNEGLKTWSEPVVTLISKDAVKSGAVTISEGAATKGSS
ncbi:hypothetical protein [Sediminibacterium ginsengisoli]|uniref:Uncharacterized protein n=1 Tax=Sediminibacterium ginsengisoli TaxID=413434 RepID=A0A1T4L6D9_9BACT|nr:hypothetical protein [Sediminibacterium ginsengisoli]SJZ50130.1 hypothetical protein SAMN04488132_102321 [Sediminibacterium ginsengisoli]